MLVADAKHGTEKACQRVTIAGLLLIRVVLITFRHLYENSYYVVITEKHEISEVLMFLSTLKVLIRSLYLYAFCLQL